MSKKKKNKRIKSIKTSEVKINTKSKNEVEVDYPIFCFKHLVFKSKGKDYKFYYSFLERLQKISNHTWSQISTLPRHGFGTEKIPVTKIKPQLPNFITPDVKELVVFRANGDNRPFLGIKSGKIFHVIFLEEKFGDIYDH